MNPDLLWILALRLQSISSSSVFIYLPLYHLAQDLQTQNPRWLHCLAKQNIWQHLSDMLLSNISKRYVAKQKSFISAPRRLTERWFLQSKNKTWRGCHDKVKRENTHRCVPLMTDCAILTSLRPCACTSALLIVLMGFILKFIFLLHSSCFAISDPAVSFLSVVNSNSHAHALTYTLPDNLFVSVIRGSNLYLPCVQIVLCYFSVTGF